MGTDIHMFIEKQCKYGETADRWILASPLEINDYKRDLIPIE